MRLTVLCPHCEKEVIHNVSGTISLSAQCKECGKLIIYNPVDGVIVRKEMPQRASSSGIRFY